MIAQLKKVVRLCLCPEPVPDKNGADSGKVVYRLAEAIKALELIGKSCGLFAPNASDAAQSFRGLSEDDRLLLQKIAGRMTDDGE